MLEQGCSTLPAHPTLADPGCLGCFAAECCSLGCRTLPESLPLLTPADLSESTMHLVLGLPGGVRTFPKNFSLLFYFTGKFSPSMPGSVVMSELPMCAAQVVPRSGSHPS